MDRDSKNLIFFAGTWILYILFTNLPSDQIFGYTNKFIILNFTTQHFSIENIKFEILLTYRCLNIEKIGSVSELNDKYAAALEKNLSLVFLAGRYPRYKGH